MALSETRCETDKASDAKFTARLPSSIWRKIQQSPPMSGKHLGAALPLPALETVHPVNPAHPVVRLFGCASDLLADPSEHVVQCIRTLAADGRRASPGMRVAVVGNGDRILALNLAPIHQA